MGRNLKFSMIPGEFAVSQLNSDAPIPPWADAGTFASITRTLDELSIVCLAAVVPADVKSERGWACLKLLGPFPFQETGILASFLEPCAAAGIPIFAISTFDTDYILVKEEYWRHSLKALSDAGHELV